MHGRKYSLFLGTVLVIALANFVLPSTLWAATSRVLYSFGSVPDGNYPAADLVFDHSGHLYGTTVQGGAFGSGAVFKLTPGIGQWTETIIYNFCQASNCSDGSTPYAGLVVDGSGNLYGTTYQGGAYGGGVVFELVRHAHGGWTERVLHSFGNGTDGKGLLSGLVFDKAGNLYGTTSGGGTSTSSCFAGCGTVFELSRGTNGQWNENVLYNFCSQTQCADGNSLTGGLVLDTAGNLYGTTVYGGTIADNGIVFELTPGSNGQWTETVLYRFAGGSDGLNPHAGPVLDKSGNLYGTTVFGGSGGNNGTVYKVIRGTNGTWIEKVIYNFCSQGSCSDGSSPYGGLIFDKAGNLYGAAISGGVAQWGVVFKLTPGKSRWNETVLHSFTGGTDGFNPHAGLIFDATGNLYDAAYQGGTGGYGTVIEVTP